MNDDVLGKIVDQERFDGTRLPAQEGIGRFRIAIQVDNAVHALLKRALAAIADVRSIVVVAEEDRARDERFCAQDRVLFGKNGCAMAVSFGAIGGAGAVAVFGDNDRFVREGSVNLIEQAAEFGSAALLPAADVFVALDEVHQS